MAIHWVFNGCDDAAKASIQSYWTEKWPRLEKVLKPYRSTLQDVRLTVYCHEENGRKSRFELRGVIHLPTGTLTAEATAKDMYGALDRVVDVLVAEIKRHKERVRKDYLFRRKTRRRENLSAAGPLLERDAAQGRREDFFQLLRPMLNDLRDHARRELRRLEQDGVLDRGEVTVTDLLDDVLKRAWERFADRPRRLRLDLWLTNLLHETLEDWIRQEVRPHESLEEEVNESLPSEAPQVDDQEWWAALLEEKESFPLADVVPGWDGNEIWDELEAEEQRDNILAILNELPAAQRQAFLLHALEDYSDTEIAMIQDRSEREVKADIDAARRTLKERLTTAGYGEESPDPTTSAAHASLR